MVFSKSKTLSSFSSSFLLFLSCPATQPNGERPGWTMGWEMRHEELILNNLNFNLNWAAWIIVFKKKKKKLNTKSIIWQMIEFILWNRIGINLELSLVLRNWIHLVLKLYFIPPEHSTVWIQTRSVLTIHFQLSDSDFQAARRTNRAQMHKSSKFCLTVCG